MRTSHAPRPSAVLSAAVATTVLLTACTATWANGRNQTIAFTGQTSPDGQGTLNSLITPALSNNGSFVAFRGTFTGTPVADGIFVSDTRIGGSGLSVLARVGEAPPVGPGAFRTFFDDPTVNASGQVGIIGRVLIEGQTPSTPVVYIGQAGQPLTQIARGRGEQTAPGSSVTFETFSGRAFVNDNGQIGFRSVLNAPTGTNQGLYLGGGGSPLTEVARLGNPAPGGGTFASPISSFPAVGNGGHVAFQSGFTSPTGTQVGVFVHQGGVTERVAVRGQAVPDGNGVFGTPNVPSLNASGDVAFQSNVTGSTIDQDVGIFAVVGGQLRQIARREQAIPGGSGTMGLFVNPDINNAGQVATRASVTGGDGGVAIVRGDGQNLIRIAQTGQTIPGGVGTYSATMFPPAMNDAGTVTFLAGISGGGGGSALFLSDGIDEIIAVRSGQVIDGATLNAFEFRDGIGPLGHNTSGFNNFGQVAYRATLVGGGNMIGLYTPDLNWRAAGDGDFDAGTNWTLSLAPGNPHDVFFAPATSATANVSAGSRSVNSLQVGGGAGAATLALASGAVIDIASTYTQLEGGLLQIALAADGNGMLLADTMSLAGGLDVVADAGFSPGFGDTFDLLAFNSLSGVFATVNLPGLGEGLDWDTSGLYTLGQLSVVPEPASLGLLGLTGLAALRRRRA